MLIFNCATSYCYSSVSMQEPEPIDWEYYRKGIGSRLVDMYKQAYDGNWDLVEVLVVSSCSDIQLTDFLYYFHCIYFLFSAEVKIPQYVDNVTPQYKPKIDALVRKILHLARICDYFA